MGVDLANLLIENADRMIIEGGRVSLSKGY
jgi:hypothetical protein